MNILYRRKYLSILCIEANINRFESAVSIARPVTLSIENKLVLNVNFYRSTRTERERTRIETENILISFYIVKVPGVTQNAKQTFHITF